MTHEDQVKHGDRARRPRRRRRRALPAALVLALLLVLPATGSGAPIPDAGRVPPDPTTHELSAAGAAAILAGNYPRAAQLFKEAAAIDPEFTQAYLGLAIATVGTGDRGEFDAAVRRTAARAPRMPEVRYLLAAQGWIASDLRAAEDEARDAVRADPAFLEARYLLGMAEAARGNLDRATATLREALRVDPSWAPVHFQLGAVLAASGDLEGAVGELRQALSIDAAIAPALSERAVIFADRRGPSGPAGDSGPGLPLPVPNPVFLTSARDSRLVPAADPAPVPEWFLDYVMAGFLEDRKSWSQAATLFARALTLNDREATRVAIGGRQVDYLPHRHLARARLETGDLGDARAHLEVARRQGATPAATLGPLETLIRLAASRTRLVLKPLPDRTADEAVAIRGLVLTRDHPAWVDVGGQKVLLRPATTEDLNGFAEDPAGSMTGPGIQPLYFEVPSYPLPAFGPHTIRIRSEAAGAAGAEAEVLILREGPVALGAAHPTGDDGRPTADGGSR
jgi:tetratricopeptide (TPR) repeat protein